MKLIIHEDELNRPNDLSELYQHLMSDTQGGYSTGKYTDVTGTRIELADLTIDDAQKAIKTIRPYLPENEAI